MLNSLLPMIVASGAQAPDVAGEDPPVITYSTVTATNESGSDEITITWVQS